jgi:hypothetical protein
MPAEDKWDLIRGLKGKALKHGSLVIYASVFLWLSIGVKVSLVFEANCANKCMDLKE